MRYVVLAFSKQVIRCQRGVSVLEVVVSLSIAFILSAIAIPNLPTLGDTYGRSSAIQQFEFDLQRARSEAMAAGARSILAPLAGANGYSIGLDYVPYDPNLVPDEELFRRVFEKNVVLSMGDDLVFNSQGFLIDETTEDLTNESFALKQHGEAFETITVHALAGMSRASRY